MNKVESTYKRLVRESSGKIGQLSIAAIMEEKIDEKEVPLKEKSKAGTWIDDELIVSTYPMNEFVKRIMYIGYDFTGAKMMADKMRKVLPDVIKKDKYFARAVISVMSDPDTNNSEKADLLDANIDDFIEEHSSELSRFSANLRDQK